MKLVCTFRLCNQLYHYLAHQASDKPWKTHHDRGNKEYERGDERRELELGVHMQSPKVFKIIVQLK
ncbi:MAG: hypothetical protein FGF51_07020 [Candidatus Brockarchaeota archaeon]|nr:hypothetical protein [Candidatus Brockarchaeota archaeon]